jgi:glycine cleavage system H protein
MSIPKDLKYTKEHEWVRVEGKSATVGVTDHAQSALGDVVFIELPSVGREFKKGSTFGVVESIKAVSDLYAPLSGTVTATHTELTNDPSKVNREPYTGAWMLKIEISDPAELSSLMDASAYEQYISTLK